MAIALREAAMVTLAGMVGCHLIGGVTDLEYVDGGGGHAGEPTSSGSSTGGGTAGGGGEGLTGPCQPGDSIDCYTGPEGTRSQGLCSDGVATCTAQDTWGPCEGEVLPQPEICANGIDESCDGEDAPLTSACLSDDGLVARYFIDEGTSGPATGQVLDSGPGSEHLAVTSVADMPDWWLNDEGKGLRWEIPSQGGRVSKSSSQWVYDELQDSTTATMEIVVHIQSANTQGLFIGGLWADTYELSFWLDALTTVFVVAGTGEAGRWSHPDSATGTNLWGFSEPARILHAVYDSTATNPSERLVLYVDGQPGEVVSGPSVTMGQGIDFPFAPTITFGNVPTGEEATAMGGTVYYLAFYEIAMSADQIADHVAILEQSHDRPEPPR